MFDTAQVNGHPLPLAGGPHPHSLDEHRGGPGRHLTPGTRGAPDARRRGRPCAGPGKRAGQANPGTAPRPDPYIISAFALAETDKREHERATAPILPEGHRPVPVARPRTLKPSPSRSTTGPARSSAGRLPPKSSTSSYAHFNHPVLHRPVEPAQYASAEFARFCAGPRSPHQRRRTGVCWDNPHRELLRRPEHAVFCRQSLPAGARARIAPSPTTSESSTVQLTPSTLGYRTPPRPSPESPDPRRLAA